MKGFGWLSRILPGSGSKRKDDSSTTLVIETAERSDEDLAAGADDHLYVDDPLFDSGYDEFDTLAPFARATLADLPEFGVGHSTNPDAMTGCTAFVARGDAADGAVCGVDVRGGAPATRETDLLRPENMVQKVNAVLIGGGSAFGLEASCGAMEALAEAGMGFELGGARVPIVPAACLFDLLVGKPEWPGKDMGREAVDAALSFDAAEQSLEEGSVGAGTGATVDKVGGIDSIRKGGFGFFGVSMGELVVMSFVAVNSLGAVVKDMHGGLLLKLASESMAAAAAAAEDAPGDAAQKGFEDDALKGSEDDGPDEPAIDARDEGAAQDGAEQEGLAGEGAPCANTTLGVVLTNAKLDKAQATKVSQMTQDAYARCIVPTHTPNDGDTIFTMASGKVDSDVTLLGMLACFSMEKAIHSAMRNA